jgi:PEP-CTERM motif
MIFIKRIASLGAAMLIGLSAPSARAGYVVDLTQVGGDVVASGSGAIDPTGLSFVESINESSFINPSGALIYSGPVFPNLSEEDFYLGITGPKSFGSGGTSFPSSGSGDLVGIDNGTALFVPTGYVSGNPLLGATTYDGATLASLGATPGTYKWTWGSGANQNFTLVVGAGAIPEPSTWAMMLIGFAGLGLMGYQSARRRRAAGNA